MPVPFKVARLAAVSVALAVMTPDVSPSRTFNCATVAESDKVSASVPERLIPALVTAVVTANALGGVLQGFTIVSGGSGYVLTPTITISDPTGSGAVLGAITLSAAVKTVVGQEVYPFSAAIAALQVVQPGAASVIALQSISVSWGSMKPTIDYCSWTEFQARYRSYNIGNQNYPAIWSQYGRGAGGSVYLWPIPGQVSQMDWDAYCYPIPLVNDATVEAIPYPFTASVKYYAAHLAYLNAQRKDDAQFMMQMFKENMVENGVASTPSYSPSAYDGD